MTQSHCRDCGNPDCPKVAGDSAFWSCCPADVRAVPPMGRDSEDDYDDHGMRDAGREDFARGT